MTMELKQVTTICFSPTGTTGTILKSIARGITPGKVEHIDLTLPEEGTGTIPLSPDQLVLLGAPVYGGRLPINAIHRFKRLGGSKTLAVLIVVYGNREFEDALLELKHLAIELGFLPVAGGAFIGEHSFATEELPIATGRPDSQDVQRGVAFGERIKEKIRALPSPDALGDLLVPGRFPYEGGARSMAVSPVSREDTCILCGTCASVCPTGAISVNGSVLVEFPHFSWRLQGPRGKRERFWGNGGGLGAFGGPERPYRAWRIPSAIA
jgi:ferredoxin